MPGFYFENYELSDSYFFVGLKFGRQAGAFPGATQTILANYYDMSVANFLDGNPANPWQQFWVLQTGDSRAMPLGGATGQRVLYCLGTNGTRDGAYWVHGGACVQIVGNTMTCDGQYL